MSLSNSTLEPAEAVPRRVERDTYSVADVRKALCYLLAHVEKGDAPPTPWVVAHKILGMPAMYYPVRACVFTLLPRAKQVPTAWMVLVIFSSSRSVAFWCSEGCERVLAMQGVVGLCGGAAAPHTVGMIASQCGRIASQCEQIASQCGQFSVTV